MALYEYRKGEQIERYIAQFMRVFSGFQVRDGVERDGAYLTKRVPVVYGNMSRIVASIINKRDHMTNQTVPIMAANMVGLTPDPNNKKSPHHRDTRSMHVTNNQLYDVVDRLSGPAFIMNMELSVYASSTTELFDIVEQILLIFNPRVTIQTSSQMLNSSYITDIALTGIQPEIQYPMGMESPIAMMALVFEVPIRLNYPQGTNDKIILNITENVKTTDNQHIETFNITGDTSTGEVVITKGNQTP